MSSIERPRLSEAVRARRYLGGRAGPDVVVLFAETAQFRVTPREWRVVSFADGVRTRPEIASVAQANGIGVSVEEVDQFFERLDRARLLDPARAPHDSAPAEVEMGRPRSRLIRRHASADFRCDGRGECCSSYGTLLFSRDEVRRAHQISGSLDEILFLPETGASSQVSFTPTLIRGRCSFLEESGECELHRKGGPSVKPMGCRIYPLSYVDDDVEVRVSASPSCTCVFRGLDVALGDSIKRSDALLADREVGPVVRMRRLPSRVSIDGRRDLDREAIRELWSRARSATQDGEDVVSSMIAGMGCMVELPPPDAVAAIFSHVAERFSNDLAVEGSYRAESDFVRRRLAWLVEGASLLTLPACLAHVSSDREAASESERHFLDSELFTYRFLDEGFSLREAAWELALRVWLARAVREILPVEEPEFQRFPIVVVEGALRSLGRSLLRDGGDWET